jgi:glycosyltransferase involved in cell wall biosynthesis
MVLFVGVMERQDGVRLLIESIEYLVKEKRREDTLFVLIGSGTEFPILKTLTTQLGLNNFVEFTGLLPHEQVGPYLSTADVCVAPDPLNALNNKSTMIKILEYMAYSRPVVLYELEEGRRTAGEGALYARPNDPRDFAIQIEKLLDSEELRRRLGELSRKRTEEELNWKVQSSKLVAAYASVLSENDLQEKVSPAKI